MRRHGGRGMSVGQVLADMEEVERASRWDDGSAPQREEDALAFAWVIRLARPQYDWHAVMRRGVR